MRKTAERTLGGGVEGLRRHAEEEMGSPVELHRHSQQAHSSRAGGYALRHLSLEHHDQACGRQVGLQEVAQHRRRDVVRQVGDDGVRAAAPRLVQEVGRTQAEDVGADDDDVRVGLKALP